MADVVRAKYRGKDSGDGLPYHHGIPARDLTDDEFDALPDDQKEVVRKSALYDYATYTDKPRDGKAPRRDTPTEQPSVPNTEGETK